MTRQIVLDTETTGLSPKQGHRIIEIGCVELVNRRLTGQHYHQYINPQREIDPGAQKVHGITSDFLQDKPYFTDVVDEFLTFIKGAELIIHNAPFDVGFINHEFKLLRTKLGKIEKYCQILDTLAMARALHPGQRNSLDALCKRYEVDNTGRDLHGGLLDAQLLALTYLAMTTGQDSLFADEQHNGSAATSKQSIDHAQHNPDDLVVIKATQQELMAHQQRLQAMHESRGDVTLWQTIDDATK
ncbi:MAG: DNA polymerase III subunit epsilon [Gammaproteobacteria bacterium]|nr:DNA polymerase III subunit epsilon [Gammaproteobacteria bacterium]